MVVLLDKLSTTTAVFFRSEGKLKSKHLYGIWKPESYGGARPKITSRAKVTSVNPSILPQETVAKTCHSHSRARQDQQLENHAALLRDEVFSVILGTLNMQHSTAMKNRKVMWQ